MEFIKISYWKNYISRLASQLIPISVFANSQQVNLIEVDYKEPLQKENYIPSLLFPLIVHLDEKNILERKDLHKILETNKDYRIVKFFVPNYFSNYLLCYFLFDILDLLSNELHQIQTRYEFEFENKEKKLAFVDELKMFLKLKAQNIQKKKIIPIYSKFIEPPSFQIDYNVILDHKFHILFIKELDENISIQRIYFSIDV
jgi:hypothetical protein